MFRPETQDLDHALVLAAGPPVGSVHARTDVLRARG
jgi:hypothetical protein